jgi:hypothetical protein
MSSTAKGALIGAGVGAATGAIISRKKFKELLLVVLRVQVLALEQEL